MIRQRGGGADSLVKWGRRGGSKRLSRPDFFESLLGVPPTAVGNDHRLGNRRSANPPPETRPSGNRVDACTPALPCVVSVSIVVYSVFRPEGLWIFDGQEHVFVVLRA